MSSCPGARSKPESWEEEVPAQMEIEEKVLGAEVTWGFFTNLSVQATSPASETEIPGCRAQASVLTGDDAYRGRQVREPEMLTCQQTRDLQWRYFFKLW